MEISPTVMEAAKQARLNTFKFWIFAANRMRVRPISVMQVKSIPLLTPQSTFEPCPESILQMILMLLENAKIDIQPHIINMLIRKELLLIDGEWFCPLCCFHAGSKKQLYVHINNEHAINPFKCICNSMLLDLKTTLQHFPNCSRSPVYPDISKEWRAEALRSFERYSIQQQIKQAIKTDSKSP